MLKFTLPIIVFAQFCCTSLWFAGNAVMKDLVETFGLPTSALGQLTSSIQLGFIAGTLVFAVLAIADRFSPSKVFWAAAFLGAVCNLASSWEANSLNTLLAGRFMTGFFLAGIYPVGMKIAADYFDKDLGKSLGYLVGALVLGTAFPHLLKGLTGELPWRIVLYSTSALALLGGLLIGLLVADGPYRKASQKVQFDAFYQVFKHRPFRRAAFGYFGHMWELYTFWAFVPILLSVYPGGGASFTFNLPICAFLIIGAGGLGCVLGGYASQRYGVAKIARLSLLLSGLCCLLLPIFFYAPPAFYLIFLTFWGLVVVADSPLFSTLVAQHAPPAIKGTALTIVTCIGFAITILSLLLVGWLHEQFASVLIFMILALGPVFGYMSSRIKQDN